MGREDLHHNMEDTFDDKEIIKTGDLVAYDCAYIGRAHLFFSIDFALLLGLNNGRRHIVGEREDPFFALRERHRDVDILFFPSFFPHEQRWKTTCSSTETAPDGREVRVTWSACASVG